MSLGERPLLEVDPPGRVDDHDVRHPVDERGVRVTRRARRAPDHSPLRVDHLEDLLARRREQQRGPLPLAARLLAAQAEALVGLADLALLRPGEESLRGRAPHRGRGGLRCGGKRDQDVRGDVRDDQVKRAGDGSEVVAGDAHAALEAVARDVEPRRLDRVRVGVEREHRAAPRRAAAIARMPVPVRGRAPGAAGRRRNAPRAARARGACSRAGRSEGHPRVHLDDGVARPRLAGLPGRLDDQVRRRPEGPEVFLPAAPQSSSSSGSPRSATSPPPAAPRGPQARRRSAASPAPPRRPREVGGDPSRAPRRRRPRARRRSRRPRRWPRRGGPPPRPRGPPDLDGQPPPGAARPVREGVGGCGRRHAVESTSNA